MHHSLHIKCAAAGSRCSHTKIFGLLIIYSGTFVLGLAENTHTEYECAPSHRSRYYTKWLRFNCAFYADTVSERGRESVCAADNLNTWMHFTRMHTHAHSPNAMRNNMVSNIVQTHSSRCRSDVCLEKCVKLPQFPHLIKTCVLHSASVRAVWYIASTLHIALCITRG